MSQEIQGAQPAPAKKGQRMSQLVVFPRGQLTDLDRARLDEIGVVAVEADDPTKVVAHIPGAPLASADDLLMSALEGIVRSGAAPIAGPEVVKALLSRLLAREQQ